MKKLLFSCAFLVFTTLAFGQFVENIPGILSTDDQVYMENTGSASTIILVRTDGSGGVGDGAAGTLTTGTKSTNFRFDANQEFRIQAQLRANLVQGIGGDISQVATFSGQAPSNSFYVAASGNVGLGTDDPQSKLSVDGQVLCEEAKVVSDIAAPDYVFAPEYKLRTLEEVEQYINKNSHLPEIPSAAEFADEGILVGKMSFDLLKKVEELTLYMIDLKKENELLKARLNSLETKSK